MGAQAAAGNDLFLQGLWEKKDAAGQSASFDTLYVRAIKLSPNQKGRTTEKKVKGSWAGTRTMHSVSIPLSLTSIIFQGHVRVKQF